jgi:hypothetical protein
MQKVVPRRALITTDPSKNVFFGPINRLPDVRPSDPDRLTAAYRAKIWMTWCRRSSDCAYIRDEYLPHCHAQRR